MRQDAFGQPDMRVAGKGRPKPANKLRVTIPKLGPLAEPFTARVPKQDKATPRLGQTVAPGDEAGLKVLPGFGIRKVGREERPQGSDEPLIRPIGRLRSPAPRQILCDGIADDLADRHIARPRDAPQGVDHVWRQSERDLFHLHHGADHRQRWLSRR